MKKSVLIFGSLAVFCADIIFQWLVPGFSFLMPMWLIFCALSSRQLSHDLPYLIVGIIAYDFISGFPFAIVTYAFVVLLAIIGLISRWIAFNRMNYLSLAFSVCAATFVLTVFIYLTYAIGSL